ncbi:Gfo/Idh/MocA family protein [Streptomyces sp. HPF1205]|uniref:Gfo/Idh/MocA family protein n=1 Tax=Streptomyces sp. HPF1205 TaxID=2873262 RepID=UPI001CED1B42|nr:Gfo/Idh/MocA family oxidoreductase [Streptomyces sp. HPF1205]
MSERYTKVRWGILATGGIAATFTEALQTMPDAEVVAVASRRPESAKAFGERYGIGRTYGDWARLAADDEVDVVYVATPHSAHRAAAGLCLEAGKPVLCEKAFTLNTREAQELVDLARGRGLFLMEAMWTYCNPLIRHMVTLVAEGAVGEVRHVSAHFGFSGVFGPTHRLRDPAQGGGALLDLGVYPVSFAHLFLGEPDHVAAWAHLTPERVDENTTISLGWNSGAVASLSCSITADTGAPAVVAGTGGRIEIPDGFFHADRFVLHRPGHAPHTVHLSDVHPDPDRSTMRHEAAEVARCLRAGLTESPLVPLDGSLAVMRTLDAIRDRVGVRYPGVD